MVQRNATASIDASKATLLTTTEHIKNKNFTKGIYNRARRTLPHGMTIEPVETHVTRTGVWAQTTFPKGCIFGPYEGPGEHMVDEWKEFQSSKTSEDLENQFNERMCNWMIFINSARNRKETNLEPIIHDGEIFFRVVRSIKKVEQLLVSSDVEILSNSDYSDVLPIMQKNQENSSQGTSSVPVQSSDNDALDDKSSILKENELSFDLTEYLQQNQIELIEKPVNYEPHNRTDPVRYKGTCPPGKTVRGNEPYACKQCGARFAQNSALMKHENTHMEDLGRYRCSYCGRVFIQKGSLHKHEQIHSNNQKIVICRVCSVWFDSQSELDDHFKVFHSSGVGRAFPCFICGNGFTKLGSLRAHQKVKHPGKCRHTCRFCMKEFKSKDHLNTHEFQHLSEKPFACQFCSLKFSSRSKLMKHITGAHKEVVEATAMTERESLVCYYCGYTYSVHTQFIKHVKLCKIGLPKDNTVTTPSATGSQYQCCQCNAIFVSRDTLEEHLSKQHADRPFKCDKCLNCFKFSCNLKRHLISHGNFPHYCNFCNTAFRDSLNFENHQCKTASTTGKPLLICPVCRRGFHGRSQHTRHVALCKKGIYNKSMAYRMKKQPVFCQRCKKGFSQRKELFAHEKGCLGPLSEKQVSTHNTMYYGCGICRKAFSNCSLLKIHLKKVHTVENRESKLKQLKLNLCLACKRSFKCLKGLSRHVNHCPALGRAVFGIDTASNNLSCSLCYKSMKTYTQFKSHRVKCKLRNRSRKLRDLNKRMIQSVNKDLNRTQITESSRETESLKHVLKGESISSLPPKYVCKDCGKSFMRLQGLGKHKLYCRTITNPHKHKQISRPNPRFKSNLCHIKCSGCFKVFVNRSTLFAHKATCDVIKRKASVIKKRANRFVCTVCDKSFHTVQGLRLHQRSCMPDITSEADESTTTNFATTELACRICGRKFKKIQGLAMHESTCMPNIADDKYPPSDSTLSTVNKKVYECKYCHARFQRHYFLGSHVRNCSNRKLQLVNKEIMADIVASQIGSQNIASAEPLEAPNDPFICRKCGTSFDNEEKLVEHDYVCCPEFDVHVFNCDKCSLTFSKESDLLRHQESHNRKTVSQCDVCGKTFLNNAGLGKHRNTCVPKTSIFCKTVTRKITPACSVSKNPLKCHDCGNHFTSTSTLNKHKQLNRCKICHNCTLCGTNFKSFNAFNEHSEKCQQIRQHHCKICGRGFRTYGFLVRHVQITHEKSLGINEGVTQNTNSKTKIKVESKFDDNKPDVESQTLVVSSATTTVSSESYDNESYSCGRCFKKFPTLEEFADHEELEHAHKNECCLCFQRFKTERELLLHRKHHPDVYKHKCKMCPMRYKFSAHMRRHFVRKHTAKGQHLAKQTKM